MRLEPKPGMDMFAIVFARRLVCDSSLGHLVSNKSSQVRT
jgi:hypothetical protein